VSSLSPDACRSCGAPIVWVVGATGRRMPCDLEPVVDDTRGLIRVPEGPSSRAGTPFDSQPAVLGKGKILRSHFATCPDAAQHRRRSS
jgi:hypothetical protein